MSSRIKLSDGRKEKLNPQRIADRVRQTTKLAGGNKQTRAEIMHTMYTVGKMSKADVHKFVGLK